MSWTDVAEVDVLKLATGQATSIYTTTPLPPYAALYTAAPTDSSAGTEVTGSSYVRVNTTGSWGTPAAGSVSNTAAITWAAVTTTGYTVLAVATTSASSAGSILRYASTSSTAMAVGDQANMAIGAFVLTQD